jgi:hypothetical protein
VWHRPGLWLATKGRERSLWLLVVAVCGALPAVVLAGFTDSPPWLEALAGALGVVSGLVVAELRAGRLLDDTTASARRAHVAGALDELPCVGNVDLGYAGVHPALVEVGYVARAAEAQVSDAVQQRGRVLIVGKAMSGKTRMAAHVAQTLFGDHQLFKPKDGAALHHLLSQGIKPNRLVVWLDRLDLFLGSAGLGVDDLRAFCEDETVVIATVRLNAYEALLPHDGLQSVDSDVLEWFGHPVVVDWADGELARGSSTSPAEPL